MVVYRYRLVGLDGRPHPVLDTPYETLELALTEASNWCTGQGLCLPLGQRGIAVEVWTDSGNWRTIDYPVGCLLSQLPIQRSKATRTKL
ncbi:hypothetical protein [Synechococcus sp. M16CYN]|uniref:hypothetical protein n=1 Tax=Synechococcus sp. M16CYN TaxID=3103139 RepID=UPI0032549D9F